MCVCVSVLYVFRMSATFDHLAHQYTELNLSQLNCEQLIEYQYIPTLSLIIAEFDKVAIYLLAISCLFTFLIVGIFVEECWILFVKLPLRSYYSTVAILAVFPISAICFFLTLLMPRSHDVNTTMATLYQPLSLVLFYKLIVSYMGREKILKQSLIDKRIVYGPPFCLFTKCLPPFYMNKKLYYLIKACIYQLFLAPCLLYFVMGVCTKTGVYIAGQFSFENAAIYIIAVGALSLGVGILCLQIFYLMAQSIIPGYYITSKYYIVQAYFVITRIHVLLFDALGNNGYLLCVPPISAFATSLYLRSFLLILFSLLLSLAARVIFTKPAPNLFETITDSITGQSTVVSYGGKPINTNSTANRKHGTSISGKEATEPVQV